MKKLFLKITILVVLFFIPKMVFGSVVINEVLYNAEGNDTGKEYVILYNNGDLAVDLTNWDLDPSSANYFTIPSFILNAKSSVVIHINGSGINSNTYIYTGTLSNMKDSEGPIALFNSTSHTIATLIDYIEYGAGNQVNESKAVSARIWTADAFIPNISTPGKAIKLQTTGVDNNSPSDWIETNPSIIQETTSPSEESIPEEPEIPIAPTENDNPPIADAGDNIIGFVNQEITLDGSFSYDMDENELQYSWNTGDGNSSDHQIVSHIYQYPGTYLATLTVYDGRYYVSDTITIKIQTAQITINEFMANPNGIDEVEEWIEIYNDADSITDISGWQLDDIASGSKAFIFPKNTLIAPKNYLVFSRQTTKIALNNDKDSVRLLLPDGIVFQEINYEKPPQGKSSARTAEGFVWSEPTPGMANIAGMIVGTDKNTTYQQNFTKSETVKEPSKDYVINLPDNQIEGGYIELSQNEPSSAPSDGTSTGKLASIKQSMQNPFNLALLIICIVFASGFIGLLLIKRLPS